jgi:predicted extracellular nuclease
MSNFLFQIKRGTQFMLFVCTLVVRSNSLNAQTLFKALPKATGYTVVFYNVENLYDTIDDQSINDAEFQPGAENKWDTEKYTHKLSQISKVLSTTDSIELPAIIGLTEIENLNVLKDLVNTPALKRGKYKIIHEESKDPRGIDVALLYKPSVFRELSHHKIPVSYDTAGDRGIRECLYVCGILGKKDTLHLVINHWKSRTGGTDKTEGKRLIYAQTVRHTVDSLFETNTNAQVLLMGDFNDTPTDSSTLNVLRAQPFDDKLAYRQLYNLSYAAAVQGEGSHYYKNWEMFDQIIVSTALLMQKNSGITSDTDAKVFKRDWMCYRNSHGLMVPDRSYASGKYHGGFSDHFPVMVKLWILK